MANAPPPTAATAEFDIVQSKLSLMEGRVRGALHQAEDYRQRVGALLKGLEEAIVLFEDERIVLAAGATEDLLGWKADEVERDARSLFPANEPLTQLIRQSWSSGQPIHNSEMAWGGRRLKINIDFISDESGRTLTLLRVRDAESATHVESQLQIAGRLEAINRLTGGVAHEIKNPLNAIAARLALLESIVEGDQEAEGQIRVVADEIQRLDRIVRTFLDFTQPLKVHREESRSLRAGANGRRGGAARGGKPSCRACLSGRQGHNTRAIAICCIRALMNIVVNAVEATPSGGEVVVDASESDRQCRLRICDTGPGIPDITRKKIFQLYFTTKSSGSGIGLAVAYRSLQLHGGDVPGYYRSWKRYDVRDGSASITSGGSRERMKYVPLGLCLAASLALTGCWFGGKPKAQTAPAPAPAPASVQVPRAADASRPAAPAKKTPAKRKADGISPARGPACCDPSESSRNQKLNSGPSDGATPTLEPNSERRRKGGVPVGLRTQFCGRSRRCSKL